MQGNYLKGPNILSKIVAKVVVIAYDGLEKRFKFNILTDSKSSLTHSGKHIHSTIDTTSWGPGFNYTIHDEILAT